MSLDRLQARIYRKIALFRGRLLRFRGAKTGQRFGVERQTQFVFPGCFRAGDDVTIGEMSYLHCRSARGVEIGNRTSIDRNLWLHCGGSNDHGGDGFFKIGDRSYIGCNAVIGAGGGGIQIGNDVLIGQCVNIHAEKHNYERRDMLIREQGISFKGVVIEDDVWIGSKATILDGVTIGRGAIVGAGAVVTKPVPPYSIVVGVPAKVVGERKPRGLSPVTVPAPE